MDTGSAKELAVTAKLSKSYKQVKESSDIESRGLANSIQSMWHVTGNVGAVLQGFTRVKTSS